ncbi:MAG: glycosyltransferase family 4 protein [Methanobacterium sp.]
MDIGIVQPELIYPRGAEKLVCELGYNLDKRGHKITIYTFEKKEDYAFDSLLENIDIISLNKKWIKGPFYSYNLPRWLYLIKKISKNLKNHDIINAHNHPAQWISKYTEIPTVWSCNEPYLYNLSKILGRAYYFHHKILHHKIDQYLSSNVSITLSISEKMRNDINLRYRDMQIKNIYIGADIKRKINHINNDFFDVIFVGPIIPLKRPMDILNSLILIKNKIPNIRIHFVGKTMNIFSIKYKNEMIKKSQQNGINVIFYDSITNKKLYELLDIADISIFVPESEPFGIFPLETILGEIPTIISDQCGCKEILSKDYPIIKTGDINGLAGQILDIFNNNKKYKGITNKNAKIISENYSWENYSKRMETLFKKTLKDY